MKKLLRYLQSNLRSRRNRRAVWAKWYHHYDTNPFDVDPAKISRQTYLDLAAAASARTYPAFIESVEAAFGFLPVKSFVDELALSTQVVIKKSKLLYLHGHLLYAALRHYLAHHPDESAVTILETGTARGFSALCMARALHDAQREGRVLTIDVLPSREPIYWNCIHDAYGKKTRFQLLEPWKELVEAHVVFLRGHSDIVLQQLGVARIHFAFLDSAHNYDTLSMELRFVAAHQRAGDVIVCDDYTPAQYPGVVRAVDELLAGTGYESQLFTSEEGRGYMHCRRTAD
jgi:predicted O-methyltransferase YrrM